MTTYLARPLTDGPLPRYAQILQDLRARIRKGDLMVEDALPGLFETCEI